MIFFSKINLEYEEEMLIETDLPRMNNLFEVKKRLVKDHFLDCTEGSNTFLTTFLWFWLIDWFW